MSALSSIEASPRRDAVAHARELARLVWLGDRSIPRVPLDGLNEEAAVRVRMAALQRGILTRPRLPPSFEAKVRSLDIRRSKPLHLMTAIERLLREYLPDLRPSIDAMLEDLDPVSERLVALVLTQSIAGRLGVWSVSQAELADAALARRLTSGLSTVAPREYRGLVEKAHNLFRAGAYLTAARALLRADRITRTVRSLLELALCLSSVRDFDAAHWVLRAALLERDHCFLDDKTLLEVRAVEAELRERRPGRPTRHRAVAAPTVELVSDEGLLLARIHQLVLEHSGWRRSARTSSKPYPLYGPMIEVQLITQQEEFYDATEPLAKVPSAIRRARPLPAELVLTAPTTGRVRVVAAYDPSRDYGDTQPSLAALSIDALDDDDDVGPERGPATIIFGEALLPNNQQRDLPTAQVKLQSPFELHEELAKETATSASETAQVRIRRIRNRR